ncbi:MAG TPA: type II toxin-antitoxin system HicA family toxin [Candidatus Dormibacteraeota bacterium]|nr:type II toxin-antitoxin system HicA family toxin [Candidatus Dormibacteraeota bacterium]
MPKRLGSSEVIRVLQQHGFFFATQKGSHAKYKNADGRIAIVPHPKKELPIGLPGPSSASQASPRRILASEPNLISGRDARAASGSPTRLQASIPTELANVILASPAMRDKLTKERRSWNMSRIRGKHTTPEKVVRSALHRMGFRFRLQVRIRFESSSSSIRKSGFIRPDILLHKFKTAISSTAASGIGTRAVGIARRRPTGANGGLRNVVGMRSRANAITVLRFGIAGSASFGRSAKAGASFGLDS